MSDGPHSEPRVWTVSRVNRMVRGLVEDRFPPLWISGEVANWKRAPSGHCYFTLKDASAQLRCVMWRTDARKLPVDPDEGMRVKVFGQVTLYEARGDLQLSARRLEAEDGEGLWKLAFERLRKQLDEEGLLDPARKRPLPRFPRTVGVVTSLSGAALHDVLTVLRRRAPWLHVIVKGARVQGEGAALEIADGIDALAAFPNMEVLVVGRGGGSIEDLWAFNEEPVARAIASSPVPVVSAVGHEVDVTISDLVADFRAPTPSAAAEAIAPDVDEILRYLEGVAGRLARGLRRTVEGPQQLLNATTFRLGRAGRSMSAPGRASLQRIEESLSRAMQDLVRKRRFEWLRLAEKVDALSPLSVLSRGYSVALDAAGRVLRTPDDFAPGQGFQLRVLGGRIEAETKHVSKDEVEP